jgi:hypothetical protein
MAGKKRRGKRAPARKNASARWKAAKAAIVRNPDPHATALIRSIEDQGQVAQLMDAGRAFLAKKRAMAKKESGYEGAYYPPIRTYKIPYDEMHTLAALRQLDVETGQGFEMSPARDLGHTLVRTRLFVPGIKQYAYEEGWESFGPGAMELIEYRWTHKGERESRRGKGNATLQYQGHYVVFGEFGQDTVEVKGELRFDKPASEVDKAEIADAIMEDVDGFLDDNPELWGDQGGDEGDEDYSGELENPRKRKAAPEPETPRAYLAGPMHGGTYQVISGGAPSFQGTHDAALAYLVRHFPGVAPTLFMGEAGFVPIVRSNPLSGDPDAYPVGPYCIMCYEHEAAPGDTLCHRCRSRLDAEEAEADHEAWLDQQAVIRREYMNPFFSPPAIQYSTVGALANPGPLATFTNDADQMQANVYAVRGGFSVAVLDLDSGETDPHIRIYPTLQQATAAARTVLGRS